MMGGPIDTRQAPTAVNTLATQRPFSWFEQNVIATIPMIYPGAGRKAPGATGGGSLDGKYGDQCRHQLRREDDGIAKQGQRVKFAQSIDPTVTRVEAVQITVGLMKIVGHPGKPS